MKNEVSSNWYINQYKQITGISNDDIKIAKSISNDIDKFMKSCNYLPKFNDLEKYSWDGVRMWMHYKGAYILPTEEFIDWLYDNIFTEDEYPDEIMDNKVIEIGAGNGFLGRALGIKLTDSKIQNDNKQIAQYYGVFKQPVINYPSDVIKLDANTAVRRFKPHTVIGSYITFGSKIYEVCQLMGASYYGPDMEDLLRHCDRLILIGNIGLDAHRCNPILDYPHKEFSYEDINGLITRGNPIYNRIWVWDKSDIYAKVIE